MKKPIMLVVFAAIAISALSQNVIKGEYFIDSDPGIGNATDFTIQVPDSDFTQTLNIPYSVFKAAGYHNVFMRVQDSNGNWSHTSRNLAESEENPDMGEIIKVEYFFNKDNGVGNNSFVLIDASSDKTWNFNIPFEQLPTEWKANDTLSIRVQQGSNHIWSLTALIDSLNLIMVGINDLEELGLSIYPNPFSDEIHVTVKNEENLRLILYDNVGKIILDKHVEKSTIINAQNLTAGVYVLIVYSNTEKLYGTKIIKP